jgi:hypothetical protein
LDGYSEEEKQMWLGRIQKVKASSDNTKIDKVPEAGMLKASKLVMHNGLVIDPLSYYGAPVMRMLMENKSQCQNNLIITELDTSSFPHTLTSFIISVSPFWKNRTLKLFIKPISIIHFLKMG